MDIRFSYFSTNLKYISYENNHDCILIYIDPLFLSYQDILHILKTQVMKVVYLIPTLDFIIGS